MIDIVKLRNTVNDRAVTGASGYDATFIPKVNESQMNAINMLAPHWEKNQAVKDALGPFIKTVTRNTTINTGLLTKESDYVHMAAILSASGRPAYPINNSEVAIIKTSPTRQPGKHPDNNFYYQKDNQFYFLPTSVLQVEYSYIRKPVDAVLTLVPSQVGDEDYLVPTGAVVNLEWPENLFELFVCLVLEKRGIEMKDQIVAQYAALGLTREMINTEPQ